MASREKRYGEAGQFLGAALRARGVENSELAREAQRRTGTVRGWISGWAAPDRLDTAWSAIGVLLGQDDLVAYRRLVEKTWATPLANTTDGHDIIATAIVLADRGRPHEARALLDETLPGDDSQRLSEAYVHVGRCLFDRGDLSQARTCYERAVELLQTVGTLIDTVIEELGARLMAHEHYDEAVDALKAHLAGTLVAPRVWRRLGIVLWYDGQLVDAYAALTTALGQGDAPARVKHARGQVAAELGRYEAALEDLAVALADPLTSRSAGYALSAVAYCLHKTGQYGRAGDEFARAEVLTPRNAWLSYRRGLCARELGPQGAGTEEFERSLTLTEPALLPRQRSDVHTILGIIEVA